MRNQQTTESAAFNKTDKIRMFRAVFLFGLILLFITMILAYSAQLKFQVNEMTAESEQIKTEIGYLKASLESDVQISEIEEKAKTRLGMVYPTPDRISYIETYNVNDQRYASEMNKIAFNVE